MKCTESEEEEVTKGKENQLQLSCFINQEVKYLFTGLKLVRALSSFSLCLCEYPFLLKHIRVLRVNTGALVVVFRGTQSGASFDWPNRPFQPESDKEGRWYPAFLSQF